MSRLIDAFWRALAYCVLPRVIWLTMLPLVLSVAAASLLGFFYWADAVSLVRQGLDHWSISQALLALMDHMGVGRLRAVLAPLIVVSLAVPVLVILSMLLVAGMATPALAKLVRARRFPQLASRHVTPWWSALGWSAAVSMVALLLLIVSLPLWLIPTVGWWLPPLIWGWLTSRVMSFDALADLATPQERVTLMRQHRQPLLLMGVICGYLGAAPAALWASGAISFVLAPFVLVLSMWIYTLVFAFSSLWFLHFLLDALRVMREGEPVFPADSTTQLAST